MTSVSPSSSKNRRPYHLRPRSKVVYAPQPDTDKNNRRPYHLRPRSKVVYAPQPDTDKKTSPKQRLKPRIDANKLIAERAKLPSNEIEDPGARFLTMTAEELRKYIRACSVVYTPPKRLSDEEKAQSREEYNLQLANIGLSYLNTASNMGPTYELVKPVNVNCFHSYKDKPFGVIHSNFEAKLQNNPEAQVELFFVEIVEKVFGEQKVTHCCSLGPSCSPAVTGLNGCRACSKINHPKRTNVRFIIDDYLLFEDLIYVKKSLLVAGPFYLVACLLIVITSISIGFMVYRGKT